jgi:hypothetical protein
MHWGSRLLRQFSNTGNSNSEDARINEVAAKLVLLTNSDNYGNYIKYTTTIVPPWRNIP